VNHLNSFGCNALQWSAQSDHLHVCRWLASVGLDIAVINRNGHSAVHKAALKGQDRICAWLLNEECLSIAHMMPDLEGNTPADLARLEGFVDVAAKLDASTHRLWDGTACCKHGPYRASADHCCGGDVKMAAATRDVRKGSDPEYMSQCVREARMRQVCFACTCIWTFACTCIWTGAALGQRRSASQHDRSMSCKMLHRKSCAGTCHFGRPREG
jgi:Ankyrin repeats (3 copies)